MSIKLILSAATALTAMTHFAAAQEHRELGAHVHGVSTLEIAIEGGEMTLNLLSPGMDIVGFEYEATSDEDKDAVEAAIRQFTRPEELFVLDEGAHCRLAEVLTHLHSGDHDHADTDEHAAHSHEHEEHADEAEEHDHDGEEEEHEHGEHEHEHGEHSEFHARYEFACDHPDELQAIAFPFFDIFANAQEIEATIVTDTGASAVEIGRDTPTLSLP
ncbi:zinc uptake protein ZrgA [Acuticoccus mangrovi]|uniref:DUF2796 domain-containing protein n=1 Tax=Acuticoccus mangrovi TaxID=2796142 RepID=A0A934IQ51_9HYPH|nr:DUF2796 domain-containing protein [Acuticoccus mangrovi]MBJ3778022.1 DUF2796 domain-containing protein [Acuticoccus mangrovi]